MVSIFWEPAALPMPLLVCQSTAFRIHSSGENLAPISPRVRRAQGFASLWFLDSLFVFCILGSEVPTNMFPLMKQTYISILPHKSVVSKHCSSTVPRWVRGSKLKSSQGTFCSSVTLSAFVNYVLWSQVNYKVVTDWRGRREVFLGLYSCDSSHNWGSWGT